MKVARLILLFILSAGFSNTLIAARFWISATSSNWNNPANWSNVSGGAGGFSVPGVADDVNFDNLGTGNCNIDAVVSIKSITVASGYSGNIIQGTNSITMINAALFAGGSFTGGSANITIPGVLTISGTAFTSSSAILELKNNAAFTSGSFTHNSGTVRFNGSFSATISGTSPVFYNLEFVGNGNTYTLSSTGNIVVMNNLITSGTLFYNIATGTIDVKGDINSNNSAAGCGGDAIININGPGTQNFNGSTTAGAGALPQLVINKAAGTLNLSNFPAVSNNFTYSAGAVSAGASTFSFTHGNVGSYNIIGTLSLGNIAFNINTSLLSVTVANTITATGDLTIAGAGNLVINTGNINVNGNIILTNTGNGGGGSAAINIVGAGSETMDGTAVTVNQSRLPVMNINKPGGTLFLSGNISFSSNVTYTSGSINAGISTCYIVNNLTITGSFTVYNLSISPAGNTTVTIAPGSIITAMNILDLENGANYITINTGTIAVQGNIIDNNTSTAGGGSGTILINGTGTQSITSTGIIDQGRLPAVTINKTAGTLTLPSLITVRSNWNYQAGTLDVITNNSTVVFENTLNITGSQTLNNVTFDGSSNFTFTIAAGTTLTVSGTMNMVGNANIILNSGNINLNGDLVLSNTSIGGGGTSVMAFVSGVNQSISSSLPVNQNCLPSVTINKSGGTLTFPALITVKGNWTYSSGLYDVNTNNSTIVFASPLGSGLFGITGTHSLNNVTFEGNNNNTASVSTGTILTVTGTLSTIGPSNVFINTPVTGAAAIAAQGDVLINNTSAAGGGTGLILISGTGAQAFTSTVASGQGGLPYIKIQKASGTLTMAGIFTETRDWSYTSGVVDATTNSSTVLFGSNNLTLTGAGMNFYHLTITSSTTTLGSNLSVYGNLTINGTGNLSPASNTIDIKGNWVNRATTGFTEATSTVNFSGNILQTITCPGGDNFTNLTINNSGAGVQLANGITVAGSLNMLQGNIDLNSNTLSLGISVATNGTLSRTVGTLLGPGTFLRWVKPLAIADGSVSGLFPVGTVTDYRPFYISAPVTAPAAGGTIAVSYSNATTNSITPYLDGAATIMVRKDLNWGAVTANGLSGGIYNLQVQGTGFGNIGNVTDLRLTLANSAVGTAGINGGTVTNPQVNRTALSLLNLNNTFYIGSTNSISSTLPMVWISFTVTKVDEKVLLNWSTASEINNNYFTVQRSKDGTNWDNIKEIPKSVNSTGVSTYTAYDETPYSDISYYRLQQTDMDGKHSYSAIRAINKNMLTSTISVYPNPATERIIVTLPAIGNNEVTILNSEGQVIRPSVLITGTTVSLSISNLKNGYYFVHIKNSSSSCSKKILIIH